MSLPCIDALEHFKYFLLLYVHTVLHLHSIYLSSTLVKARFHNTPVFQSRSSELCGWILDAIETVYKQLHKGRVGIMGIVIYAEEDGQVVERYVFDVSTFPVMESSVLEEIERLQAMYTET